MLKLSKKKKLIISAVALVLVAAIVLAVVLIPRRSFSMPSASVEVVKELVSGTVENGSITKQLVSGAAIEDSGSTEISLAGDIKLTSWAVSEGDFVEEDQLIASVDKVSALSALEDINTLMQKLDAAIESSRYDTVSTSITASTAGRVKAIYASSGTTVAQTMAENGALLLLSLDGYMAVDIDAAGLQSAQELTVTLDDGTVYTGTVSEISDGVATVTISDETALPGQNAVVSLSGNELGSGELYVHSELSVTGYTGTVQRVNVSLNASVSSGQTLVTLASKASAGTYEKLLAQRQELEEQFVALFKAYESGGIYAPSDGLVSGVDDSLLLETSSGSSASNLSAGGSTSATVLQSAFSPRKSFAVTLLSAVSGDDTSGGDSGSESGTEPVEPTASPQPTESPSPSTSTSYIGRVTDIVTNEDGTTTIVVTCTDDTVLRIDLEDLVGKTGTVAPTSIKKDDIIAVAYVDGVITEATVYQNGSGSQDDQSGQGQEQGQGGQGGTQGSAAGGGASSTTTTTQTTSYTMDETAICTLTPYTQADIVLSVDELDIGLLSVGQSAEVTLDALPGQSFEGTITEIDPVGSNDGGDTKYNVTVSIERTENMYTGMNATVRITLGTTENVLVIPATALNEDVSGVYVYTAYDKRSDELSSPVYVTTGSSDGDQVEITSGLSLGDSYYYYSADTLKYSFSR